MGNRDSFCGKDYLEKVKRWFVRYDLMILSTSSLFEDGLELRVVVPPGE
jgi:hypothetical protein